MESESDILIMNQKLKDAFGLDSISGLPIWRIVWSEAELEKRYGTYDDITPSGIFLRQVTEVREVPKYKQWIHAKYVLERLVVVPEINQHELPEQKLSYEPLWVFEDAKGNYLPPKWEACEFIIHAVLAATGKGSLSRYNDPEDSQEASLDLKKRRVDGIIEELYGDDSGLAGSTLEGGNAIVVPPNYKKVTIN